MSFRAIAPKHAERRAAAKVVTLQPSAFAESWAKRPTMPVQIGLRLVSDEALDNARASAAQVAWEVHGEQAPQGRVEAYNETLIRSILAQACVKPSDSSVLHFGSAAESVIAMQLTSDGVLALWEAYELLKVETSPLSPEVTDGQLQALATAIADGSLMTRLHARDQRVIRRILRHAIDEVDSRAT